MTQYLNEQNAKREFEETLARKERENAALREALATIADQDDVELALDPQWAKRMARAALEMSGGVR